MCGEESVNKSQKRAKRIRRTRAKISGTASRPRLCVFRSLKYIYAQIIDDENGRVLASVDSRKIKKAKNNIETAGKLGEEIAKIAMEKKIKEVFFDKHGYKYHGKVKAVADGARKEGLKF
ncbi:MAG: 50S ribosomal protein L18 [Candidatus Moranbacteria bacterium RBG_13_45_13]|nr:MAG: 50S ribosomal protein L18 [Candidatus Moranbacteria bacterium RBG_13_45_13]